MRTDASGPRNPHYRPGPTKPVTPSQKTKIRGQPSHLWTTAPGPPDFHATGGARLAPTIAATRPTSVDNRANCGRPDPGAPEFHATGRHRQNPQTCATKPKFVDSEANCGQTPRGPPISTLLEAADRNRQSPATRTISVDSRADCGQTHRGPRIPRYQSTLTEPVRTPERCGQPGAASAPPHRQTRPRGSRHSAHAGAPRFPV